MHFKFLKIPVYIQPNFCFFLMFCMWGGGAVDFCVEDFIWGFIVFLGIFVHEYGHALTAYFWKGEPTIVLKAFGGITHWNGKGSTKRKFFITLAGQLLGSVLILVAQSLLWMKLFDNYYIIVFLHGTVY